MKRVTNLYELPLLELAKSLLLAICVTLKVFLRKLNDYLIICENKLFTICSGLFKLQVNGSKPGHSEFFPVDLKCTCNHVNYYYDILNEFLLPRKLTNESRAMFYQRWRDVLSCTVC